MSASPPWLDRLLKAAADMMSSYDNSPLVCHCQVAENCWEVTLFVTPIEVVAGASDGRVITLPYHLELPSLPTLFDELESFAWQTARLGRTDDLGPHISLTGRIGDDAVWLRVLAAAPAHYPASSHLNAKTFQWVEQDEH